jgi:ribonuclease P protein component
LDCAFRAQFAFAVPKKIFQHATDRNKIKRLMRESVRLQKHLFSESLQKNDKQIILLLSYHAKSIYTFSEIDEAIKILLNKIVKE